MLSQDLKDIICYLQAKGINPAERGEKLFTGLTEASAATRNNFLVYDFENDSLFYANSAALEVLPNQTETNGHPDSSFLENTLHPVSYQLVHLNTKIYKDQSEVSGIYYLKTRGKNKYSWVYATGKVMSFNNMGSPKLIYTCFFEIEKAISCYLKILHSSSSPVQELKSIELLESLKPREIEILSLIADEFTSKEISDKLNISQVAVDAARKRLIKKLNVKSLVGLVKIALYLGLSGRQTQETEEPIHKILRRETKAFNGNGNMAAFPVSQ